MNDRNKQLSILAKTQKTSLGKYFHIKAYNVWNNRTDLTGGESSGCVINYSIFYVPDIICNGEEARQEYRVSPAISVILNETLMALVVWRKG